MPARLKERFFKAVVVAYVLGMTAQVGALIHLFNRVSDDVDKAAANGMGRVSPRQVSGRSKMGKLP